MCFMDFTISILFFLIILQQYLCYSNNREPLNPSELRTISTFHSQVDHVLQRVRLSKEEVQLLQELVGDVEGALQDDWPGTKIIPYGSIISGIGLRSSDIDLYVSLPPWAKNNTPPYRLVSKAEEILSRYKYGYLFENVTAKHTYESNDEVPILKLYHKKSKQECDISFNTIAVIDNKLISYLIHTDNRVFKLMFLIKFWGKVLNFPAHVNSMLRIFVIFYLQQLDMLPPIYILQKMSSKYDNVKNWDTTFEEPFYYYYNSQNVSLYHLLGGFFRYYTDFAFKNHIVSAFAGHPIKRYVFSDVQKVPDIFVSYKRIIGNNEQYPLNISSEFCVPQFFIHNFNSGNKIDKNLANILVNSFHVAAKLFLEKSEQDFMSELYNNYAYDNNNTRNAFVNRSRRSCGSK